MLKPRYPLETSRLVLRAYKESDLERLHAIYSLPEVVRHLYGGPRDLDEVRRSLTARINQQDLTEEGQRLYLAVTQRGSATLIGEVMLRWHSDEHRQGELGYIFHPGHQGKGYAGEAAKEVLRLAFDEMGLHRVYASADADNASSIAVMKRLGMRMEAHFVESEMFKGHWGSEVVYAMLRREWDAAKA